MVLSDVDIKRYIEMGKIKIAPELPPEQFGSCSVDFRLGSEFNVFEYTRHPYIDPRDRTSLQQMMRTVDVEPGELDRIEPQDLAKAVAGNRELAEHGAALIACASLADGVIDPERLRRVVEYAHAMHVSDGWVREVPRSSSMRRRTPTRISLLAA